MTAAGPVTVLLYPPQMDASLMLPVMAFQLPPVMTLLLEPPLDEVPLILLLDPPPMKSEDVQVLTVFSYPPPMTLKSPCSPDAARISFDRPPPMKHSCA